MMLANAQQFINPQFVVTDPTRLWLFLDVDELSVTSLASGRDVSIHTPAYPETIFHGQLEIIGHELDPTTRTIKTRCRVDNSDHLLRAEMYVTADVASSETAPGQFTRRSVKPGVESDSRTAITDGISPGERVVGEGCLLLESILEGENP